MTLTRTVGDFGFARVFSSVRGVVSVDGIAGVRLSEMAIDKLIASAKLAVVSEGPFYSETHHAIGGDLLDARIEAFLLPRDLILIRETSLRSGIPYGTVVVTIDDLTEILSTCSNLLVY